MKQPIHTNIKALVIVVIAAMLMSSCITAKKHLENGNYEAAVELAAQKLRKGKVKDKHILVAEEAYNIALQQDLDRIEYLKREGEPENWEMVFALYNDIKHRQNLVKPLLPLFIESQFRSAEITMINVDDEIINAKAKAADYLYSSGVKLLVQGDKQSKREAYNKFSKVKRYYNEYKDVDELMAQAHYEGMNHVALNFRNTTDEIVPKAFEAEVMKVGTANLNSLWVSFDPIKDTEKLYDYDVVVNVSNVNIGPEQVKEREWVEKKEIVDGWKYLLDDKGNVMKDTLGNDIKVDNHVTVRAIIKEVKQHKVANISGTFDFYDNDTRQLIRSLPFREDMVFDHCSAIATGDKRALKVETKTNLGGQPVPFPEDHQMIMDGAANVKSLFARSLRDNTNLVLN